MQARSPGGEWAGIALSMLVHSLLLAVLLWGMRWKSPPVQSVSAELWASVPVATAPAAAPAQSPPPAPTATPLTPSPKPAVADRQADIALQQARKVQQDKQERDKANKVKVEVEKSVREKAEREKSEREKAQRDAQAKVKANDKSATERREKAAAEAREAKQREENLARMMGQLGGAAAPSAKAQPSSGAGAPSASYAGRIVSAVKPNIVFADALPGNPSAEVEVRTGPGGTIIGRTLVRSSGHRDWDEAVLRAIDRTGTLPRDVDGSVPPRLTISFRLRD